MDGSCFVSQGVQNPTLTMLALAARSCDYLSDATGVASCEEAGHEVVAGRRCVCHDP